MTTALGIRCEDDMPQLWLLCLKPDVIRDSELEKGKKAFFQCSALVLRGTKKKKRES